MSEFKKKKPPEKPSAALVPLKFESAEKGTMRSWTAPYSGKLQGLQIRMEGDGSILLDLFNGGRKTNPAPIVASSVNTVYNVGEGWPVGLEALDEIRVEVVSSDGVSKVLVVLDILKD